MATEALNKSGSLHRTEDLLSSIEKTPPEGDANPTVAVARESFGNKVAGWIENVSYAAPFVAMVLFRALASTAEHYNQAITCMAATVFGCGLVAKMAQEFQQNVEPGSFRTHAAYAYMGLGLAGLLSKTPGERLVDKLNECPAGLKLWTDVKSVRGIVTVVNVPQVLAANLESDNQILIPSEMNQVYKMSKLVDELCALAPQKGVGVPTDMLWALQGAAQEGKVSKEAYLSTWGKIALSTHHCWGEVVNECVKSGSWDFFTLKNCEYLNYGSAPEEALAEFVADPVRQERFYGEWEMNYKTAFCDESPDHADCQ